MKRPSAWLGMAALTAVAACSTQEPDLMVGTLERDRIELKVESDEPIVAIPVTDGAFLNVGDVILEQDSRRHQARLDRASAQRDQAAARLAELQRGPRQEAIREAQARLTASEALTRDARAAQERLADLFARGLAAESDRDTARSQWEAAAARTRADREALSALLHGTTVEELQQAQAALQAAEAGLREAKLARERLILTAPVAGRMDKVLYQTGERPPPGATVAVLLDTARNYARIYVPEHLKAQVTVGTALELRLDGIERVFGGSVRWVSSDASFTPYFALTEHDRSRLSYLAEVAVEDAGELPSGLPLEARIPGHDEPR
jgi:HlyD family secretion protein